MPHKTLLGFAALLGFLGVALGAFGSHILKDRLPPEMLNVYDIGIRYHLVHAVAAVAVALALVTFPSSFLVGAGWLFILGTLFFSGSLYLLAFTGIPLWGMLTPVGGLLLLGGWLSLMIGAWRS